MSPSSRWLCTGVAAIAFVIGGGLAPAASAGSPQSATTDAAPPIGSVYSWGANNVELRGLLTPRVVDGMDQAIAVAEGAVHHLALRTDGTVWAWGANGNGQLGDGTFDDHIIPLEVPGLTDVIAISAGTAHSMALRGDGTLWTWGDNAFGELGRSASPCSPFPWDICADPNPGVVTGLDDLVAVAGGHRHSLALKRDGTVWAWGLNKQGQVGAPTGDTCQIFQWACVRRPISVPITGVTAIAANGSGIADQPAHSLAVTADGSVWAWGDNSYSELGAATTQTCEYFGGAAPCSTVPLRVGGIGEVSTVAAGGGHNLALRRDGTVWAWGLNNHGQLGDTTTSGRMNPQPVSGLNGVSRIAAGYLHSLALRADGTPWAWGSNDDGQIGDGTQFIDRLAPAQVSSLSGVGGIAGGAGESLAFIGPIQGGIRPVASFSWAMARRTTTFSNGVPRYPSDIDPGNFQVNFDACSSLGNRLSFAWTVLDPAGHVVLAPPATVSNVCNSFQPRLAQLAAAADHEPGSYQVTLRVADPSGVSDSTSQAVKVKDILLVSIGDSIASGEGNPDQPGQGCDEPSLQDQWDFIVQHTDLVERVQCTRRPLWQQQFPSSYFNENQLCHRSTRSGAAQAARSIETTNPHVSVTFLDLSCSGATVADGTNGGGLLTSQQMYVGTDTAGARRLDPQIARLAGYRGQRPVDVLFVTAGADDIDFDQLIAACSLGGVANAVLQPILIISSFPGLHPPHISLDCGDSTVQRILQNELLGKLVRLSNNLSILNECIDGNPSRCFVEGRPHPDFALHMSPGAVFITGYYDPARADSGAFCEGFPLTNGAWSWAENGVVAPLNQTIGSAASRFGWRAIGDFNAPPYANSFLTHGYCATSSWIRQLQSDANAPTPDQRRGVYSIQGDLWGFMHPNALGHLRYADSYVNAFLSR